MTETRVMKFGARRVIENETLVREQMSAAHRYYNALIELERDRRQRWRDIRSQHAPGLDEQEAALVALGERIDALRDDIKRKRQRESVVSKDPRIIHPVRRVDADAETKEIAALKEQRKELYAQTKESRAAFAALLDPARAAFKARTGTLPPRLKEKANERVLVEMLAESEWNAAWKETAALDADANARKKRLRAACGVSAGTYAATEDAVMDAAKKSQGDPRFARWDGGRKLGVQIPGGMTIGAILAGQSQRVQVVQRRKPYAHVAGNRRDWEYAVVRIRLGSDDERAPIWCGVEVLFHRAIPADALVTWVYLVPERCGLRTKYSVQLTVNAQAPLITRKRGEGVAHVRLRWSREPKEVVATGAGRGIIVAEVDERPVVLPYECVAARDHANELRGYADAHFDTARNALHDWLAGDNEAPEWMAEQADTLAQWRNHGKLAAVVRRWLSELPVAADVERLWREWKSHRLSQRDDLFAPMASVSEWLASRGVTEEKSRFVLWLEWWRRKDVHLVQWSEDETRKAIGRRNDFYRVTAARMVERFDRVEIDKPDLAAIAKREPAESTKNELHELARRQRVYAAPHEFVLALTHAFGADRVTKRERSGDEQTTGGARKSETVSDAANLGDAAE